MAPEETMRCFLTVVLPTDSVIGKLHLTLPGCAKHLQLDGPHALRMLCEKATLDSGPAPESQHFFASDRVSDNPGILTQ